MYDISAGGDINKIHVSPIKDDIYKYPIYANAKKNKGFYAYSDIFKVEAGVITVAGRGVHIGIAHTRNHCFYPIVRLLVLAPKSKQDLYFFENQITNLKLFVESTGVPQLTAPQISSYKVYYPILEEQHKIANFLSSVEKKILLLTEKQSLLQQYKKGIMQQLFAQEIRFKDEQGNEFPDWEEKQLRQIVTPIKRKAEKIINNVMTISAGKGFLHQADRFSQIIAGTSLDKYTHIKRNEFSYNRGNSKSFTYGCIYRQKDYDDALVPFVYRSFSLDEGVPEFFEQLFLYKFLDRQLRRLISSSARMDGLLNIGEKGFYKVVVIFPNINEQKKIASFLGELDKKIAYVGEQIALTKTFKKGLLQQMFP